MREWPVKKYSYKKVEVLGLWFRPDLEHLQSISEVIYEMLRQIRRKTALAIRVPGVRIDTS